MIEKRFKNILKTGKMYLNNENIQKHKNILQFTKPYTYVKMKNKHVYKCKIRQKCKNTV